MRPRLNMSGRVPDCRVIAGDILRARATLACIGGLVAVQIILAVAGGVEAVPEVYQCLGLSRDGLERGRVWQILSYGAVHGNWAHLVLNGVILLALGSRLERIGGFRLWWRLMLAGTLAGGMLHLLADGASDRPLVGASGAVMAAFLWLTGVSPGSRWWPVPISGKSLGLGMLIASAVLTLIHPALGLPGLADAGRDLEEWAGSGVFAVSHACHLGGAVAGWIGARWSLRPRVTLERLRAERRRREG